MDHNYKQYIDNHWLIKLDYVCWDTYIDHKDDFGNCDNIEELLLNSNIVSDIDNLYDNMYYTIIAASILTHSTTHDEFIYYKSRIDLLYNSIYREYEDSKNNNGIWKYIDITIEDLYNDIMNYIIKYKEVIPDLLPIIEVLSFDKFFNKDYIINIKEK